METKIKNLLARLAFFAADGMAEPPIVAIAKDADALLKEMCLASASEQAQQDEPVKLQHLATCDDGVLRWMSGIAPRDCELYAMPDGGNAPKVLYAQPPAVATRIRELEAQLNAAILARREAQQVAQEAIEARNRAGVEIRRPLLKRIAELEAQQAAVAAPAGYRFVPIEPTPEMIHAGAESDSQFYEHAGFVYRAMLASAPQAATEGCGACGDGCNGQGCRLERESPPTCQTCNGNGMIGGLLPNGGGYDGEQCPDCTVPQATTEEPSVVQDAVAVPKAPTWYKRSDIVKALERMNYHTAIADELAEWFLRHMQLAFNRGFYQAHGPAAATQLEELELWHLLERATGELTRRAAPHAWEQIAWHAGTEFIEQRRARLAAAQKGGNEGPC